MPVSHIGLTVSHLPTSTSFFLAALQPLGYRFLGQWGNQIGLGVSEPDFFLTQETPGIKAGAAHIAFSASSRTVVRNFYANALQAGGRPHGSPSTRTEGGESFNAAVLDLDGNSVEVIFHEGAPVNDAASDDGKSRVLTWRKDVAPTLGDNRSTISLDTITSFATSAAKKALVPGPAQSVRSLKTPSLAPSASSVKTVTKPRSETPTIQRSFTAPALTPQSSNDNIQISRKTLVGTILGAAAGAAVAYAMCKSEEDSARSEHAAYLAASKHLQATHPHVQAPQAHMQAAHPHMLEGPMYSTSAPAYSSPARSVRNASEIDYYDGYHPVRAIEAPSQAAQSILYQHPSYTTVVTGHPQEPLVSHSRVSIARSQTTPESRARSSIISSFVREEPTMRASPLSDRRSSHSQLENTDSPDHHSTHTHRSSPKRAKSPSSRSKHSSTSSKHSSRSKSRHRADSLQGSPGLNRIAESTSDIEPPTARSTTSKRTTTTSSILGRSVLPENTNNKYSPYPSSSDENDSAHSDLDTVVPSDSVSQIGSSSSSRRNRSAASAGGGSTATRRDDSRRASEAGGHAGEKKKQHKKKKSHRSEGTESTVQYAGSAMTMPVRGVTGSMVQGGQRSVVSYYG